jgi:transcriptional regulator with XRE-family HTH domain
MQRSTSKQSQHKPNEKDLKSLGAVVRALREAKGWSLIESGKQTGISRSSMCRFEAGSREPNLEVLRMLCKAFPEVQDLVNNYITEKKFDPNGKIIRNAFQRLKERLDSQETEKNNI